MSNNTFDRVTVSKFIEICILRLPPGIMYFIFMRPAPDNTLRNYKVFRNFFTGRRNMDDFLFPRSRSHHLSTFPCPALAASTQPLRPGN